MTLPNFLIVGAAKSGTTSLAAWLREHPDAFVSPKKEVYFFNHDENWARGIEWYASHFAEADGERAIGEATPHYMVYPEAIKRIAETLPEAKLIVLVRDPVERMYSSWRHRHFRQAMEPRDFATVAADELAENLGLPSPGRCDGAELRHLTPGLYAEQIEQLHRHFPPERVLVLLLDDMRDDPVGTWRRVCDFLGIDPEVVPDIVGQARNAHREFRPVWLWTFFTRHRVLERLPNRVGSFIALKLMLRKPPPDPLDAETRRALRERFAEPDRRLAEMLERELPWREDSRR